MGGAIWQSIVASTNVLVLAHRQQYCSKRTLGDKITGTLARYTCFHDNFTEKARSEYFLEYFFIFSLRRILLESCRAFSEKAKPISVNYSKTWDSKSELLGRNRIFKKKQRNTAPSIGHTHFAGSPKKAKSLRDSGTGSSQSNH